MRSKFRYLSKSALSVILSTCMLISCLIVGIVPVNAWDIKSGQTIYFDNTDTQWNSVILMVSNSNASGTFNLSQVTGSNYWKLTTTSSWDGYGKYLFYNGSWEGSNQTIDIEGEVAGNDWYTNCFTPVAQENDKWKGSFSACAGVKNFSVSASSVTSGAGTSGDPYIVSRGASFTVSATATAVDSNCTVEYSFDDGTYGTSASKNYTAVNTYNTEFTKEVTVKTTRGDKSSRAETKTVYFKTAQAPTTTKTFYIWNYSNWSTVKYFTYGGAQSAGSWPGTAVSSTPVGTINGYDVYQVTLTTNDSYIILNDNGNTQTKGDHEVELETGHIYKTEADGTYNEVYASSMLDTFELWYRENGASASTNQHQSFTNGSTSVQLQDGKTYEFWIKRSDNAYFKDQNEGTMTRSDSTNWTFTAGSQENTKIQTDGTGTYTFSFTKSGSNLSVSVTYPIQYDVTFTPSPSGGTVKVNNSSTSPVKVAVNNNYTILAKPNNGYTVGTVTAGGTTLTAQSGDDTNGYTYTANVGASAKTVTATFTENTHSLTVKRRLYDVNGDLQSTSDVLQTITGVGITTAMQVNAAEETSGDYSFKKFTLPTGVTLASGSLTTVDAITVNATVDNAVIYIDYTETLYTLTLVNQDNHGTIIEENDTNSVLTTIQVGNVTGVTLVAVPNPGYDFSSWTKSSDSVTIGNIDSANTTFKTSADATVTANYTAISYNITASASPAVGATVSITDTSGNSKTDGHIGDTFRMVVNLNPGYAVNNIAGAPGTGSVITNTASTYEIQYTLSSADVSLTVNLKAATPTLSNIQIKDSTDSYVVFDEQDIEIYYKQLVMAKAQTDSFSTLTFVLKKNGTTVDSKPNSGDPSICSNDLVTLTPNIIDKPTTENGTVSYTLTITATNAPDSVASISVDETINISIKFNEAQKEFFKFEKLFNRCISENVSNNPYYKYGAPIAAYNTAYANAQAYIGDGYNSYPAYNANEAKKTEVTTQYNTFKTAYDALMTFANKTTVYVLTKYQSTENPVYLWATNNGTQDDWAHFRMYDYGADEITSNIYKMQFAGTFQKNDNRYLYSFTYTGHIDFTVWCGSSATDLNMDDGDKLTGTITNATAFTKYYVDVCDTNVGTTTVTSCTEYADFDHTTTNTQKVLLEKGQVKTAAQIKELFGFAPSGSLVDSSNITTTNTAFSISGPNGSPDAVTYEYVNESSPNHTNSPFTADKQGKYTVSYTTKFGTDAAGRDIIRTKTEILYVAYDDITIYVDMNGNIGNPVLNFRYYVNIVNNNEVPTSTITANERFLPFEMDLVTGSESIYQYTVKRSKLEEYAITIGTSTPINISYITVENNKVGNTSGGFNISIDARTTGEVWLMADSTQMKTFNIVSYGSSANTFVAAQLQTDSTANVLASAMEHVSATGIISDDEDTVYRTHYAALYTLDGQTKPIYHFKSIQRVSAKQEFTAGGNTYYFDRWVKFRTPANGLNINNGVLTLSAYTEAGNSVDLNFTDTPSFAEGAADFTYVALYKLVSTGSDTVRVQITYNFQDYNTNDGNFVFDENKETVRATYTKTVKIPIGTNETYHSYEEVAAAADTIARQSMPSVQSRYFDYSYSQKTAAVNNSLETDVRQNKLVLTATLDHKPHKYYIVVLGSNGSPVGEPKEGYYQQSVTLTSDNSVTWTDNANQVLATGTSYTARFVSSGFDSNGTTADCQIIRQATDSGSTDHTSVIENSFTEVYYENDTKMLRHNFYIIDYCESTEGKFLGGGVLFATAENGSYRQSNAATVLASPTSRSDFITGILGNDASTEYKAQTIQNVGFRYKPYNSKEDVFRYSDEMQAYLTVYEGTNINSPNYENQTLRVYSFMVYNNNGTMVVSSSANYAEVNRYVAG